MIWCVEDDESIRDIELYALNNAGFATKGFEDGMSFWNALKNEKPELVLLDIMLPEMDGIEILSRMKESIEYKRIPVILATAKGQEYDRIKGLDLGADDYIVKPFILPNLLARIEAVLRRSNWQKEAHVKKEKTLNKDVNIDALTPKEKEVLALVAKGASNQEIADKLCVRDVTVKTHLNSVFKKLKVTNRTQAVLLAMQIDLIN